MSAGFTEPESRPAVSIVLPAFNRLEYLRAAIDSVCAQTFCSWELLVVDDGSDDEVRAWLREPHDPRIDVLMRRHTGNPSAVRNAAIRKARGRYLAFIDSDDVWVPQRLARQLEILRSRPKYRWSYCKTRMIDADGALLSEADFRAWEPYAGAIVEPLLRRQASLATSSVVVESALVEDVGGFDERLLFSEHYDLWVRLALRGEVSVCVEPLVHVRTHQANYTRNRAATLAGWDEFYRHAESYVPNRRLRALCREMRSIAGVELARLEISRRNWGAGMSSFLASVPPGLPRLNWWRHLAGALSWSWVRGR